MIELTAKATGRLADQIGEILPFSVDEALLAAERIELGRSFEVWALGLDALVYAASSGTDLAQVARPVGAWHHQILFDGEPRAYARSTLAPTNNGSAWNVQGVFASDDLARALDQAVQSVDSHLMSASTLRLLEIPAAYVVALWICDPGRPKTDVLVVRSADELLPGKFEATSSCKFLRSLVGQMSGTAVLRAAP